MILAVVLNLFPMSSAASEKMKKVNITLHQGKPGEASAFMADIAQDFPWRSTLWEQAGNYALQAGLDQDAIRYFLAADQRHALSDQGRLSLGDAYLRSKDFVQATNSWQEILKDGQESTEVFSRLADVYWSTGDIQQLREIYRQWVSFTPADADIQYQYGLLLLTDNPDESVIHLNEAAQIDPELEAVVATYLKVLKDSESVDNSAYRDLLIGRTLGQNGQWLIARAAFENAVKSSPEYAEAWAFLAEAHQQLGEDGSGDLAKALKLNPDSVVVQALQALALQRQGKAAEALVYLHRIAQQEPENPTWQVELGNTMVSLGNLLEAFDYYQNAVSIDASCSICWRALANFSLLYSMDINQTGLQAARQLVRLNPKDPEALDLMGQLLMAVKDWSTAERFILRAIELSPAYPEAHLHLGYLYLQQGKNQVAYTELSEAEVLGKDTGTAQSARKLIQAYFLLP